MTHPKVSTKTLRTPVHFGTLDFTEAVAVANSKETASYDKNLVALYTKLHYAQGVIHPSVDLATRIPALAAAAHPRVSVEGYLHPIQDALLHAIYPAIFSLHKETACLSAKLRLFDFKTADAAEQVAFLKEIQKHVNDLFAAQLTLWNKSTRFFEKKREEHNKVADQMLPLEKVESELAEATRKEREKDIARAERRLEKVHTDLAALASIAADVEAERVPFAEVREAMVPLRLLEHAARFLPFLVESETVSAATAYEANISALGSVSSSYPEFFEKAVALADTFLSESKA